ncbi:hypothetical protein JZ751_016925 [Albula glossodonta]|uniref:Uncharacterized protein n=1 Tax=Albula glossodonta TaxID=121402 RepID=A0A8T2MKN0_9TELE|nr:hypothetical protein JZ751_016925 [Albula glossodonta]
MEPFCFLFRAERRPKENLALGKINGQPKGQLRADCHMGSTPSGLGSAPLSPSRHTNVKKVSGVGGTTYEISV